MQSIGVDNIGGIHGHICEGPARIRGKNDAPAVGDSAGFAVMIRSAYINHIRIACGGVHKVVVPALAGTEIERSKSRTAGLRAAERGKTRRAGGDIVAAEEPGRRSPDLPDAHVHSGVTVGQLRYGNLRPLGKSSGHCIRNGKEYLLPGFTPVVGTPHTFRINARVHNAGILGIQYHPAHALHRTRCSVEHNIQSVPAAVGGWGSIEDETPSDSPVRSFVKTPRRGSRNNRSRFAAFYR